jgi:hypothetical protein
MKRIIISMSLCLIFSSAFAENKSQKKVAVKPPGVSDEQDKCMRKILGEPGVSERPTREKVEAAMKTCGIQKKERSK